MIRMWSVRLQGGGKACALSIPRNPSAYHDGRWSFHSWNLTDEEKFHLETSFRHYGIETEWFVREPEPLVLDFLCDACSTCFHFDQGCRHPEGNGIECPLQP